jgi:DNA repair exonuclease SbcCD ATPase subunit
MTRLEHLRLAGFRAFPREVDFDLAADAIVVTGRNGQGKTSLFDAILWALSGQIQRLGKGESVVSLYSESGEARVALTVQTSDNKRLDIVRTSTGGLSVSDGGEPLRGREAENWLLRALWPEALSASKPWDALGSAFERSVYLQQDMVRDFIEAQGEQQRFIALSELLGAGRVVDLQLSLERSRKAWSQATNILKEEESAARTRLQSLEARSPDTAQAEERPASLQLGVWDRWWNQAEALASLVREVPAPTSPTAATVLDRALKQIDARQREAARRRDALLSLLPDVRMPKPEPASLESLENQVRQARQDLAEASGHLETAQNWAAEERRRQVHERDRRQQLATMAELALGFLEGRCPVCDQTHDHEVTREHLMQLINKSDRQKVSSPGEDVDTLAEIVRAREQAVSELEASERALRRETEAWRLALAEAGTASTRLGVDPLPADTWSDRILAESRQAEQLVQQLELLRTQGEDLALTIARLGDVTRQAELRTAVEDSRVEVARLQREIEQRQATWTLMSSMVAALRESLSDVIVQQLSDLQPLLQRIYSSADPHPTLTIVQLLTSMKGGRGSIATSVADRLVEVSTRTPTAVLSSSQTNVLAVAIFLAVNLGLSRLPLGSTMLDDPLQSLDDVNLLGLVDLLRRTRDRRQLVISTHEDRFGTLLERKLRPVTPEQVTRVIQLSGWGRDGPNVEQWSVEREAQPVRLVG